MLASPLPSFADPGAAATGGWHAQLLPTLLYVDEGAQAGERWRMLIVPERERGAGSRNADARGDAEADPWDEHCITDVDAASYAGEPLNELVFWGDDDGAGKVVEVELPAFRVSLWRQVSVGEGKKKKAEPAVYEEEEDEKGRPSFNGPLLVQGGA